MSPATDTSAALRNLLDQVYQMRGMFPGDKELAAAIGEAEAALGFEPTGEPDEDVCEDCDCGGYVCRG